MNIRKAKGRWYVSTRRPPHISFVAGFDGTREELLLLLAREDIAERIRLSDCSRRKKRADALPVPSRHDAAKRMLAACRKRAASRNIEFRLTEEWVEGILAANGDKCAITRLAFDYGRRDARKGWHKNPFGPSPDRIDRSVGYVPGNVRIVLASVNIAINEWGLAHLRKVARCLIPTSV